ncbi:MAG TPA: Arc family DNA-binding protein [Thermoanaerobaculia bacterium]|jgi:plasmid stability protein|nr:Arc family DNA-binding protein [Thermoanaerobaculia bacterium]
MASITIKDFPVTLHEKLKSRAKQHRRSLNAEIITTLKQSIRLEETSVRHLIEKVRRFRSTFEATEAEIRTAKRQGRS